MRLKILASNIINYLIIPIFFLVFLSSFIETSEINNINIMNKHICIILAFALISNVLNNLKIYYELRGKIKRLNLITTMCAASCVAVILPLIGGYWKYSFLKNNGVKLIHISKIFFKITLFSIIIKIIIDALVFLGSKFLLVFVFFILIITAIKIKEISKVILYILSGCVDFILFYFVCISLNSNLNNKNIAILDVLGLTNLISKYTPVNFGVQEAVMGYYTKNLDYSFALGVNISIITKISILASGSIFLIFYIYDRFSKK